MRLAQPGLAGHIAERQSLIDIRMDEAPGAGDRRRLVTLFDDGQGFHILTKLVGESLQQDHHAIVALGVHRARGKVGVLELLEKRFREGLAAQRGDDAVELLLGRRLGKHLAGLEEADHRGAHFHRHRGGAQTGETFASARPLGFGIAHQVAVRLGARFASLVAEVQRLAKRAAVDAFVLHAPGVWIGGHQPQRQARGDAEGVLVNPEPVRLDESLQQRVLENFVGVNGGSHESSGVRVTAPHHRRARSEFKRNSEISSHLLRQRAQPR
ncbi:MAG: hypothetical protein MUF04_14790 [Akkermansiaceae bacterium]|nr:hypothetical protein [Akkermansiaceae bacterium]